MVLLLFNGRPLALSDLEGYFDAILELWFPGSEGGNAAADLLYGTEEPGGRLSVSFPYSTGQCPIYYDHFSTGRWYEPDGYQSRFLSRYTDAPNAPLYPFGYGLHYAKVSIKDLKADRTEIGSDDTLTLTVTLQNESGCDTEELVQLYTRDLVGSTVRPVSELKAWKRVALKAYEEKEVTFEIREEMLRYYQKDLTYASEPGEFEAMAGLNSRDVLKLRFTLQEKEGTL